MVERYFTSLDLNARTAHERLTRICFIDYDRELALVAETNDLWLARSSAVSAA